MYKGDNMLFDHKYPGTDLHEIDLAYMLAQVQQIKEQIDTLYSNGIVKFADPVEWAINRNYTAGIIVKDANTSNYYIAKQLVPSGIQLYNTEYWQSLGLMETADYSGEIARLDAEIAVVSTTANQAGQDAQAAGSAAQAAQTAANAAQATAQDAQTTAESIAGVANSALTTATNAQSAAASAQATAQAAQTTAENIAGTANNALDTAQAAQTTAQAAQTAAQNAQSTADGVAGTANAALATAQDASTDAATAVSAAQAAQSAANAAQAAADSKAPISHAVNAETYGIGTRNVFGHVKLSDNISTSAGTAAEGMGASSKAVTDVYAATQKIDARIQKLAPGAGVSAVFQVDSQMVAAMIFGKRGNHSFIAIFDRYADTPVIVHSAGTLPTFAFDRTNWEITVTNNTSTSYPMVCIYR